MEYIKAFFSKQVICKLPPKAMAFIIADSKSSEEKLKSKDSFIAAIKDLDGKKARNISAI